jgi:aspartyl-tRNA(Asn)/glutamyl-tRNA(Gln) amidotransferase subunit A
MPIHTPPIEAVHREPAWKLADAVRERQISALEVVDHHLARIEESNEALGAFVFVDEERARQRARSIDALVASGRDPGRLAGLPFGVKILEDVEGWPHTLAAKIFEDRIATTTSTQVERMIAAGGVPVGLTASPEMGSAAHTASLLYGVCRNPWNRRLTPGGSSGGSAAAVSAGLVPLATGSDSGGSLRIPAAYCGVFGFKGTYGRVPRGPNYVGFPNIRNYGVLARSVRDSARVLDCTMGHHERDPLSLPRPGVRFEDALGSQPLEGLKVAWTADLGFASCDEAVGEAARRAASKLIDALGWKEQDFGARLPDPEQAWQALGAPDVAGLYGPFLSERGDDIAPALRAIATRAGELSTPDYTAAARLRDELVQCLADVFEDVDLLLLPTVSCPACPAEGPDISKFRGSSILRSVAQTYVFNLSGHPAASLPIGEVGGAPVALQIVGRRHEDLRVLSAAAAWESISPWTPLAHDYHR